MDFSNWVSSIEASAVGHWMRDYVKAMPIVESIHVLALALVFGTILIVDLRLLGFPDTRRPFTRVSDELLRLTWSGFVLSVITGALMFAANATTYFDNTAFRVKMLLLIAAGLNMAYFQRVTFKTVAQWDKDAPAPFAARMAGAISMLLWISVIVVGRWIGFTKGYDFDIPEDIDFDFSLLEHGRSWLDALSG
jgi:hypothetical protein